MKGWVDCMDAGGRAMQEQLPRGENKINSFHLNLMAVRTTPIRAIAHNNEGVEKRGYISGT